MTSDKLDELPPERAKLFAELLKSDILGCDFPRLGKKGPVIQRVRTANGTFENRFNVSAEPVDGLEPYEYRSNLEAIAGSPDR